MTRDDHGSPARTRDEEFCEPLRLIRKFFPESKARVTDFENLSVWDFLAAMEFVGLAVDFSYEPFGIPPGHRGDFAAKVDDRWNNEEVYRIVLEHTEFAPSGRVVILRGDRRASSNYIVCDSRAAASRLAELDGRLLSAGDDWLFVYESGEAFVIDHDNRLYWARSRGRDRA